MNHKQISRPETEWSKVENTHESLVSQETWDFVQSLDNRPARNRSGKSGVVHLREAGRGEGGRKNEMSRV